MLKRSSFPSDLALSSDDLDVLQTFLEAWCMENSVDIHDEAASDVAAALIDWYQFGLNDRNVLKPMRDDDDLADSPQILSLLGQLA